MQTKMIQIWMEEKTRGAGILLLALMVTLVDFVSQILSIVFDGIIAAGIVALAWPLIRRK